MVCRVSGVVILFFLLSFPQSAVGKVITIASDVWCPYICNSQAQPGVLLGVINLAAKEHKLTINFLPMPLARSLKLIKTNKIDVVLALTAQHIQEYNLRQSQQVFGGGYNDFYVEKSTNWQFKNVNQLMQFLNQGNTLGVIKGYEYGPAIEHLMSQSSKSLYIAVGVNPLATNLKLLSKKRITILLDSRFNVEYEIQNQKISGLKHVGTEGRFVPLFLGFNRNMEQQYIDMFDQTLLRLRKSGQLAKILQTYDTPDWYF